jgi:hypothetical protein
MELLLWILIFSAGALTLVVARRRPRTDRDWATDHARPARTRVVRDLVHIQDLRDFRHTGPSAFVERYVDLEAPLEDVEEVWLVLAPFARPRFRPLAHAFVSFGLTGGRYVAISVEARREVDEPYSIVGGLLRRFEVTYVIGTERDLVGLRALRGDALYLYPARSSPVRARALLRDMLERAESVRVRPEFYHTFVNNCATNLRTHLNRVVEDPLPWGWGVVLPGLLDRFAHDHGLLDTDLPLDEMRSRHRVDERARTALQGEAPDFSAAIREGLPSTSRLP